MQVELGECIGSGTFGSVYKATTQSSALVAVKRLSADTDAKVKLAEHEATLLKSLCHDHIVRLLTWYPIEGEVWIIQEFAGQNLCTIAKSRHVTITERRLVVVPL